MYLTNLIILNETVTHAELNPSPRKELTSLNHYNSDVECGIPVEPNYFSGFHTASSISISYARILHHFGMASNWKLHNQFSMIRNCLQHLMQRKSSLQHLKQITEWSIINEVNNLVNIIYLTYSYALHVHYSDIHWIFVKSHITYMSLFGLSISKISITNFAHI